MAAPDRPLGAPLRAPALSPDARRRSGRSEWWLTVLIVAGVLALTAMSAAALRTSEQATDQARLDGDTASFATVLRTELQHLADSGTDVGVALALVDDLDPAGYARIMGQVVVAERFPGVFGIAYIEYVERNQLDAFLTDLRERDPSFTLTSDAGEETLRIVTNHYPLPENAPALGLDLTGRPESFAALERAVTTGQPAMSEGQAIVQLPPDEPAAVLYAALPPAVGAPPRAVAMVFSVQRFVEGLNAHSSHFAFTLTDPDSPAFTDLMSSSRLDSSAELTSSVEVAVAGQRWVLDTRAAAGFSPPWFHRASSALLLGGLATALFVGLFVRSLAARGRLANVLVDQRTAELSTVNAQLAESNARLATANRAKDAFLGSVSHELRTPLTVISGFVEAMQRLPAEDRDDRTFLAPIERNVRRLDALVADLLTMTSLNADAVTAFRRRVDLQAVLPDLPGLLAGVDHDVEVRVDAGCEVDVDPRHLDRILVNLVVNAERHGAPPIVIDARPVSDDVVEVRVRDHGPGIADTDLERMFERFARGHDRINVPGTGLGLSIVRELTHLNGGEIRYEPADPGACFVVRLVRAR